MSDKIDWATLTAEGVIHFGDKKIMWGKSSVSNAATGTDTSATFNFPESFTNTPIVVATCNSWVAIRAIIVRNVTTSQFTLTINQQQGSTQNVGLDWVAIG